MSGLSEVRRFVNYSKMEQRVQNRQQGSFETVFPKGYVEGAQYAAEAANPAFRETTAHLTERDFYERLPAENDVNLLKRLAMIEMNEFNPRSAVQKLIEMRIKKIQSGKDDAATNNENSGGLGQKTSSAAGSGVSAT